MEKKYQKRARQSLNKEQKNYTTSMSANSKYNQSKTQQLNTQKKANKPGLPITRAKANFP
jgi:hypothetical protein